MCNITPKCVLLAPKSDANHMHLSSFSIYQKYVILYKQLNVLNSATHYTEQTLHQYT